MELEKLLKESVKEYGLQLNDNEISNLIKYKDTLKDWNNRVNLTAIEDDKDIIIKHFIDSLSIIPYLPQGPFKLIDVGTGAGFPGIPVKVAISSVKITLLDSLDKRIKFLNEVINQLQLKDISAVHGRAEDYGIKNEYRETYDVSVARAVSSLPVLLEYCLPFVKVGGIFIGMKGSSIDEVQQSKRALDIIGGAIEEIKEITLPFTDIKRNIIVVRKLRQTPTKYPRKAGKPAKEPLI